MKHYTVDGGMIGEGRYSTDVVDHRKGEVLVGGERVLTCDTYTIKVAPKSAVTVNVFAASPTLLGMMEDPIPRIAGTSLLNVLSNLSGEAAGPKMGHRLPADSGFDIPCPFTYRTADGEFTITLAYFMHPVEGWRHGWRYFTLWGMTTGGENGYLAMAKTVHDNTMQTLARVIGEYAEAVKALPSEVAEIHKIPRWGDKDTPVKSEYIKTPAELAEALAKGTPVVEKERGRALLFG